MEFVSRHAIFIGLLIFVGLGLIGILATKGRAPKQLGDEVE